MIIATLGIIGNLCVSLKLSELSVMYNVTCNKHGNSKCSIKWIWWRKVLFFLSFFGRRKYSKFFENRDYKLKRQWGKWQQKQQTLKNVITSKWLYLSLVLLFAFSVLFPFVVFPTNDRQCVHVILSVWKCATLEPRNRKSVCGWEVVWFVRCA